MIINTQGGNKHSMFFYSNKVQVENFQIEKLANV
jgi:hypothetical protein